MDINGNKYTYLFATIMVIVVAVLLSGLFLTLKPFQDANVELEKRQSILKSVGIDVERSEAREAFEKYITKSVVIKNGEVVSENPEEAFTIDMAKAVANSAEEREVPLFISEIEGETLYIIPMRGKGLWGPIWGYVAMRSDGVTVAGATFDHKGETPGLGAEIANADFQEQFEGKEIMENGQFVSISVIKPGKSVKPQHEVDGISGGTITSVGLHDMLADCFKPYIGYFQNQNAQLGEL